MALEASEKLPVSSKKPVYFGRNRSFVSRARQLTESMKRTWEEYGDDYVIELPRGESATTIEADVKPLNFKQIFGRDSLVRLEIGSGNGDQIVAAAANHPDRDFMAVEVYHPGVAKTVAKAVKLGVKNLRLLEIDAQQALPLLIPAGSLDEVWTFFPDPWRKVRHHKRRLVQGEFALEVAKMLRQGGLWRLATDWSDYGFQMRDVVESCPEFTNPYAGMNPHPHDEDPNRGGFAPRWEGRVLTNFERRGTEAGRDIFDIVAQRL